MQTSHIMNALPGHKGPFGSPAPAVGTLRARQGKQGMALIEAKQRSAYQVVELENRGSLPPVSHKGCHIEWKSAREQTENHLQIITADNTEKILGKHNPTYM